MTALLRTLPLGSLIRVMVWVALALFLWRFVERLPHGGDWRALFAHGASMFVAVFAVLFFATTLMRTVRWTLLLRGVIETPFTHALSVFSWTFLVMTITPLRAGELLRPAWVRRRGGSFLMATGVLAVERLADLTVLAGGLLIVLLYGPGSSVWAGDVFGPLPLVLLAGIYFAVILAAPRTKRWVDKRAAPHRMAQGFASVLGGLAQASSPTKSASVLATTVVIWSLLTLGYHLVLGAMFPGLHWTAALAVVTLVNLVGIVWISPGNIGPYEAVAVLALSAYGAPAEAALAAAISLHATVLSVTAVQGLVSKAVMARQGIAWRDLI